MFPYHFDNPGSPKNDPTAPPYMPKSVVVDPSFDWERRPSRRGTPWHETVVYETHVKGFTQRHPELPETLRGTYAGLAIPASIDYLQKLGVTAVELLPVHQFVHDRRCVERGPAQLLGLQLDRLLRAAQRVRVDGHARRAGAGVQADGQGAARAGIEVILDVVYNHTAEGNHLGPMLSFKGIDNAAYYRLMADDRRYYMDYTGTGNTLNMRHPHVLQLIMDSLRYWVHEMHVDGFRFDLAATLARELHDVDRLSAVLRPHPAGSGRSARSS